jgi:hypothetical protein
MLFENRPRSSFFISYTLDAFRTTQENAGEPIPRRGQNRKRLNYLDKGKAPLN